MVLQILETEYNEQDCNCDVIYIGESFRYLER